MPQIPSTLRHSFKRLVTDYDAFTSVGVELSAGLGAWCFFFGTSIYEQGPLEGPDSVVMFVLQVEKLCRLLR